MTGLLATTGPATGIGGLPLPPEAIVAGVLIVLVPYGLAVIVAARRGKLGTGRHELRTKPGPPTATISVQAALSWLADAPERRSAVITGPANRVVSLDPSGGAVVLSGFDGTTVLEPRDVRAQIMAMRARRLLAADLDRLVGGGRPPIVSTFERSVG